MINRNLVKVVVFDAYGTLVQIKNKLRPYIQLDEYLKKNFSCYYGYSRTFNPLLQPLTIQDVIEEAVQFSTIKKHDFQEMVKSFNDILNTELASIEAYSESLSVLKQLKEQGYKIVICSNLALPYIEPIKNIFDGVVDQYIWSCHVKSMKPDAEIYKQVQKSFFGHFEAKQFLMVGDTFSCDVKAPREHGWQAVFLNRNDSSQQSEAGIRDLNGLVELLK